MGAQVAKETGKAVVKEAAEEGIQVLGKNIVKSLPFVGLAINGVLAIRQFSQGNILNGVVDLAQRVVTMIPGVGMGAALAVAAGGIAVKQTGKYVKNKRQK